MNFLRGHSSRNDLRAASGSAFPCSASGQGVQGTLLVAWLGSAVITRAGSWFRTVPQWYVLGVSSKKQIAP